MIDPAANASDERDHEPHCYQSVEAGGRYAEANVGHDSFGRDVELSVGHGAIRRFTESKLPTRRALVLVSRTPGRGAFHQQFIFVRWAAGRSSAAILFSPHIRLAERSILRSRKTWPQPRGCTGPRCIGRPPNRARGEQPLSHRDSLAACYGDNHLAAVSCDPDRAGLADSRSPSATLLRVS